MMAEREFRASKMNLGKAIVRAKHDKWKEMIEEIENDV